MIQTVIKIGVTYTGSDEKHNNYVHWLSANQLVDITRLSTNDNNLDAVKQMDGIVLSGGLDIHPKYYRNNVTDYPNAPPAFDEKRDAFEMGVFKFSQQKRIPLLGVCRGMQLVNCIMGGTLIQDIGPIGNAIHKFDQHDKAHGINIMPGTLLSELTAIDRSVTNSAHHQCIDQLGKGLAINCTSDDGIIEGVEWNDPKNNAFFIGVQWHPERLFKLHLPESPLTKNLRDRFIKEVEKSTKHRL